MALYSYHKKMPPLIKRLAPYISILLILTGVSLIILVLYPIVTFELFYAHKFQTVISPVADLEENISGKLTRAIGSTFADLTEARLWFPQATPIRKMTDLTNYTLSIAKLKIDKAKVIVGGEDLSKSLIHFTGPVPGSVGNPVIFGHSTLLLFYKPTDYKAIFSKLPDLEIGDKIKVEVDNVNFSFKVYQMYITGASDLKVLSQETSNEELTLVTCVPPGTYFKRFIVKSKLERI
ncbi:hypothetical protein A2W14_01065 [Candidatus Gottesmanbacteria bacterium RBG_16_37_8]|uniref:Sortase n=1 Tax=Candidatus Gottesmanbacteria bacterium RBG_16_37_8 TaxID=1798371 RepID=A0A1F5YQX1_9BACT|nr:MAG: hypothetical protein A2W14_01065 [Candidatus Gottesmanbacteria bacterium RBG_16_37_8]